VRTEEFAQAMQDASGVDLTQFKRWYEQAGTPLLEVDGGTTAKAGATAYRQAVLPADAGPADKLPLHIHSRLAGCTGWERLAAAARGEAKAHTGTRVLSLTEPVENSNS